MKFLQLVALAIPLVAAAVSPAHTYVVHQGGGTNTFTLELLSNDDAATEYRLRSAGVSDWQAYGVTTTLRLSNGKLSAYTWVQIGKFKTSSYGVNVDGSQATVSSTHSNANESTGNGKSTIQLSLLPGTTSFVAWDAALLPEMLSSQSDTPNATCIVGMKAFPLTTHSLTSHPRGLTSAAKGIEATCGGESIDVWYDKGSHIMLLAKGGDPSIVWQLQH